MDFRTLAFAAVILACGGSALSQNPEFGQRMSQERAIYFSGEVVLEDGSAPPDSVLIQRVCNGRAHSEAWTDLKGRFSFKVDGGESTSAGADASQAASLPSGVTQPIGNASQYSQPVTSALRDCDLKAVLPGFTSTSVNMALKSTLDSGKIGAIVLHPLSRNSTVTVSVTTMAAPSNAQKAYTKGLAAERAQKWDEAAACFKKAVEAYPRFAVAWYELGLLRQKRSDISGAVDAWKEAEKSDPKFVKPYTSLTAWADARQDWPESEKYSRVWIQLDPDDYPAAYLFNAIANSRLNKGDVAERAARDGLRVDKDHKVPRLHYVLGLMLMQKHEYGESAQHFRTYLELAPNAPDAAIVKRELPKLELAAGPK